MTSHQNPDASPPAVGKLPWIRWRRSVLIVMTVVVIVSVLFIARGALFPFVISIVLAELLYPAVVFLEQRMPGRVRVPGVTRVVSILTIYAVFAAVVAGILYVTIPPLYSESQELAREFPELYERARSTAEGWSDDITEQIPVELRDQFEEAVSAGGDVYSDAVQGIIRRSVSGASNAVTLVIGLAIVPFLLFYILKDREEVMGGVYSMLSPTGRIHARNVVAIANRVIGSYVRAQLLSAAIVGILVFIGLSILGVEYAAVLGLVAGLFALIPIIGPLLGAVPGLLVTLASSPGDIVWVAIVYVLVQLLENYVISPRIQGGAVALNPVAIMVTIVLASEIAGLWGVIVGVPLVAVARDLFVYFHEQWATGKNEAPAAEVQPEQAPTLPESEPAPEVQQEGSV